MNTYNNKVLFVEGTAGDKNGSLRLGFQNLLRQKLESNMPRIKMGDDTSETVRKFLNSKNDGVPHALIDLDGKGENATQGLYSTLKTKRKNELKLENNHAVYFMIQKMEAWFLSQPEIIKAHFGLKTIGKIPFNHPSKIEEPEKILKTLTQGAKHKPYHKVKDGCILLEKLDLEKLETTFEDVKELMIKLSS